MTELLTKRVEFLTAFLVDGILLCLWIAGGVGSHIVLNLLIGALIMSPLVVIVGQWTRMPFIGTKQALFAFIHFAIVVFFMLAAIDVIIDIRTVGSLSGVTGIPPYFFRKRPVGAVLTLGLG